MDTKKVCLAGIVYNLFIILEEKLPSLMESDQAKMGLNIRQIEDEVVEIKEGMGFVP